MAFVCLLFFVRLLGIRETEAHGYLATPPSKNAADIHSYNLPFADYWLRATWFVDKAHLNGDPNQKPWGAPGHFNYVDAYEIAQQAFHPCGCYNPGSPEYCAGVQLANGFGETTPGHAAAGPFPQIAPPMWSQGSVQETAFNMYANHAGGYVYMMCLKSKFDECRSEHLPQPVWTMTKEQLFAYEKCVWDCFEDNVLDFVNDSQSIQYGNRADLTVNAKTVTKGPDGTLPEGSVWREAPIPDSSQISSGGSDHGRCTWDAIDESSFSSEEARDKFIASFGNVGTCDSGPDQHLPRNWHIKDMVRVPTGLPSGKYLLMWRWDCGLANQIWSNCADVEVVGQSTPVSTSPKDGTSAHVSATSTASSTVGTTTTAMLTTTVSTTIGGGICIGEPCNSQVHCRSKWGWCGVTADHCNDESLWCGSDAAGCRCGSAHSTSSTVACRVVPGNVAGVTDCSKCDSGYKWWPCNSPSLCECTGQGQVQTQAMMTLPNTSDNGTMTTTVPDSSGGNETETTGTPNVMTGALPDNTLSSAAGNGWHPRWYPLLIIPVWAAVRK